MIWNDLFEAMLKEIAADLGLGFSKTRAGGCLLAKDKMLVGFSNFVNREGKLKILMSPSLGRPIDLGNYIMNELKGKNSKARQVLTVKIKEEMEKK